MEARDLNERMIREREILATLNHPNIARLDDAGLTADGRPYLALEYVEGHHIDDYCREYNLDLKARLGLSLPVTSAVASAHVAFPIVSPDGTSQFWTFNTLNASNRS